MNQRVTVRVPDGKREQIECLIKQEYPKLKTISDVVRLALTDYLKKDATEASC
jgi:Arc/MetJ-type ribon-helix-helix transcriptional regulator